MMLEGAVTTEENKAVVRRFYEEVHGGNLDVLDELVAPAILLHGWRSERRLTIDEVHQIAKGQRAAFPDWKVTVHDLVAEGDLVASNLTITGTHQGNFGRHAPTGRQVSFTGMFLDRVADGKIVEMWHRPDYLRLLIQIGAVPDDVMGQ